MTHQIYEHDFRTNQSFKDSETPCRDAAHARAEMLARRYCPEGTQLQIWEEEQSQVTYFMGSPDFGAAVRILDFTGKKGGK